MDSINLDTNKMAKEKVQAPSNEAEVMGTIAQNTQLFTPVAPTSSSESSNSQATSSSSASAASSSSGGSSFNSIA